MFRPGARLQGDRSFAPGIPKDKPQRDRKGEAYTDPHGDIIDDQPDDHAEADSGGETRRLPDPHDDPSTG